MYFIRIRHLDGFWHPPGKLMSWDAETSTWVEPRFADLIEAKTAAAETYGNCEPGSVVIGKIANS